VPTELFLDFDPILPWWPVVEEPQPVETGGRIRLPEKETERAQVSTTRNRHHAQGR
jgi:hypothetical protein